MPNGLRPLPNPLEVIDAVGDLVMRVPQLPGEIVQRIGRAASETGTGLEAAVKGVTEIPGDMPPDPVTFVVGAVEYVVSTIKGGFGAVKGVAEGAEETFGDVVTRGRRLAKR